MQSPFVSGHYAGEPTPACPREADPHAGRRPPAPWIAGLFGILSDPTRLKILSILMRGERDVTTLCRSLAVAQPTVSHHLALLRAGGVLTSRRDGKRIIYRLNAAAASADGDMLLLSNAGCQVHIQCPAGDECCAVSPVAGVHAPATYAAAPGTGGV